jgi:hypothetical protein
MNTLKIKGELVHKSALKKITEKFSKIDFAVKVSDGEYPKYASFQVANKNTRLLEHIKVGDVVEVSFSLQGNRSEKNGVVNYYNSLNAYEVITVSEIF